MRELRLQQVTQTDKNTNQSTGTTTWSARTSTVLDTNVSSQEKFTKSNDISSAESTREWISAFNTSLLTTRASPKDDSSELSTLMQSPEFASLLIGAKHLADTQGLSKEVATERLIEAFRKIDQAWNQIVIKRGLQAIIDP